DPLRSRQPPLDRARPSCARHASSLPRSCRDRRRVHLVHRRGLEFAGRHPVLRDVTAVLHRRADPVVREVPAHLERDRPTAGERTMSKVALVSLGRIATVRNLARKVDPAVDPCMYENTRLWHGRTSMWTTT